MVSSCIGLAQKFIWVLLYNIMENSERTFGPVQCKHHGIKLQTFFLPISDVTSWPSAGNLLLSTPAAGNDWFVFRTWGFVFSGRMYKGKHAMCNLSSPASVIYHNAPWSPGSLVCSFWLPNANHCGLPRWLSGKQSTCQCTWLMFEPWVGKIPGRREWPPTPVFLCGKSIRTEEPRRLQSMGSLRVGHAEPVSSPQCVCAKPSHLICPSPPHFPFPKYKFVF